MNVMCDITCLFTGCILRSSGQHQETLTEVQQRFGEQK